MKKINLKKMEDEKHSLYCDWQMLKAILTQFTKTNPKFGENLNLTIQYIELETKVMIAEHEFTIYNRKYCLEKMKIEFAESE
jgi:hypothetical protein